MPKKTSRSARALQAQRTGLTGERKTAARPLIDVSSSSLAADANSGAELGHMDAVFEPKVEKAPALNGNAVGTATRPATATRTATPIRRSTPGDNLSSRSATRTA